MKSLFRLAIACLPLQLFALSTWADADPYHQERLDQLIQPYIKGEYIVGLSVGIISPEGRYTYHFGETKRGGPKPDDNTLYEIGSVTKTMTGLLLADGVTRGLYDIDTPVARLLPENKTMLDDGVTLRRLSTHTSGLPRMPENMNPWDPNDPFATYTEERLLTYLQNPPMQSEPGSETQYSNLAVGLLGYALAEQAQMSFEELLQQRVLKPLGMSNTTVRLNEEQKPNMASPHGADAEPAHLWTMNVLAGAGGVRSNVQDMLTYAAAQLDPGSTPLAEAIRLSHVPQQREGEAATGRPIGLGWFIVDRGTVLMHGGQTGGFKTGFLVSPEKQLAVIVLSNTANPRVSELGQLITLLVAGKTITPNSPPMPVKVKPEVLAAYAGQYVGFPVGQFVIEQIDGKLFAKLNEQPKARLFAEDDDTFRYRSVEASIDFERDTTGTVSRLVLHQNGREYTCVRVPKEVETVE